MLVVCGPGVNYILGTFTNLKRATFYLFIIILETAKDLLKNSYDIWYWRIV
jgi:hypothetical protein